MENIFQRRVRVFFVTTFVRIKEEGAFFVKVFETHTIMENLFFNLLWFGGRLLLPVFFWVLRLYSAFCSSPLLFMRSPDLSFSFLFLGGPHTHQCKNPLQYENPKLYSFFFHLF